MESASVTFSQQETLAGKYLPIIGSIITLLTVIICYIIAETGDVYLGGIGWPYFSDIGRDSPGYYVFAIGLTLVGIIFGYLWYLNYKVQVLLFSYAGTKACSIKRTMILGVVANIWLPILSIFSTADYPSLHLLSAYIFVAMEIVTTFLNVSM